MLEPALFSIISFLLVLLMVYVWASQRNLIKNRALTPQEYLWKLKQITGKSEWDLFHIAAEEKGWPKYQVERHFKRYLEDQTLPVYVKDFLEDGRDHINAYRPGRGDFLNKKLLIFYSLFALLVLGGSLLISLWIRSTWSHPNEYEYFYKILYDDDKNPTTIEQPRHQR